MNNSSASFNRSAFPSEKELRALCGRLCDANPDLPRLKTIASVGAYDCNIGSDTIDGRRLTGTLAYLLHSGFMIDPDFIAEPVNFSVGRDFLKEDTQADLVFISFILNAHQFRGTYVFSGKIKQHADKSSQAWRVYGISLSEDHEKKNWHERIATAKAKMIATYGGQDEINTRFFTTDLTNRAMSEDKLVTLLPSSTERAANYGILYPDRPADIESKADIKRIYNDNAADLPMPWLGFVATPEYLKQAAPAISEETLLGRNARTKVFKL